MAKKTLNQLYEKVTNSLKNNSSYTYKELCKLLDETDYSARSQLQFKKRQLENWSICFSSLKKGNKFSNIEILSYESFLYNLLKQKYQNTNIYGMCALMEMCKEYSGENHIYLSKSEIAQVLGFYNKNFQPTRYEKDNSLLIEIEDETLNRFGEAYSFLKPYKSEIKKARKNKEDITSTTSDSFKSYASRKNKNVSRQIDSLLSSLAEEGLLMVQPCLIGGFITNDFKSQINFNLDSIYKNSSGYYYPYVRDDGKKQPLLVSYEDRPLSSPETDVFMVLHGEVMQEIHCQLWSDIYAQHKEYEYQKKIFEKVKKELNALFVYQSYKISFSPNLISSEKEKRKSEDSLFNVEQMTTALLQTNANSKKEDITNNKKRLDKELDLTRYTLGNSYYLERKKEKENNQKLENYLINSFVKKFVDIDLNDYFPMGFSLEEIDEYSDLIWPKIINSSKRKSDNYEKVFREAQILAENKQTKTLDVPDDTLLLPPI